MVGDSHYSLQQSMEGEETKISHPFRREAIASERESHVEEGGESHRDARDQEDGEDRNEINHILTTNRLHNQALREIERIQ